MNQTYSSSLYHHGIKGQKWGVRRFQNEDGTLTAAGRRKVATEAGTSRSTVRLAEKDAKRHVDAKMFYGKTAGTRRKLLNAELNKKKKQIPGYEETFNRAVEGVDTAKSAKKAVRERHTKDAIYRTRVTTKKVLGVTGPLTVAAGTALYAKNKPAVDAFIAKQAKRAIGVAKTVLKK